MRPTIPIKRKFNQRSGLPTPRLTLQKPRVLFRDQVVDYDENSRQHIRTKKEFAPTDTVEKEIPLGDSGRRSRRRLSPTRIKSEDENADEEIETEASSSESEAHAERVDEDLLFANEVTVNVEEMTVIELICRTNPYVKAGINLLINNLRAGGLDITMDIVGAKVRLNQAHQKVFDIEWGGTFLKEVEESLLMYGFAVTNLVPSNVKKGEMVPMVIPPTCYMLTQIDSFDKRREYRVYPLDQLNGTSYANYKRDGGAGLRQRVDPDRNVKVYVLDPPLTNGNLTSRLATIYHKLIMLEHLYENFSRADYVNSNPPYVIQTVAVKGTPEPNESVNVAEDRLGLWNEQQRQHTEERDRADISESIAIAYKTQCAMNANRKAIGDVGRYGENPQSRVPPYTNM